MKAKTKKILSFLVLFIILGSFYYINLKNYWKIKQIQNQYIEHPENLPKKEFVSKTSFGFTNLRADLYWIQAVQYIGSNAIKESFKKYLFAMTDLITELNPYFEKPYIIWQLLLPSDEQRDEGFTKEEIQKNTLEAKKLWEKWIKNFCNPKKIEAIKAEENLTKIWTQEEFKNPCKSSDIPYTLAFIHYFYLDEPEIASQYYKIASANEDSLDGAKIMAAIMQWKGWARKKAYFMFLNIWKFVDPSDEVCLQLATDMEQIGAWVFLQKNITIDAKLLQTVAKARDQLLGPFSEKDELKILENTKCGNYIHKATRELNLEYIENANTKYKQKVGRNAQNAKILFDEWYIPYLPVDYQQYDGYGIIYYYNEKTGVFDFETGNY